MVGIANMLLDLQLMHLIAPAARPLHASILSQPSLHINYFRIIADLLSVQSIQLHRNRRN